jgi:penicillin-binding protein 2
VDIVREGLWGAVNYPNGTARALTVPGVTVAGKTGTAEFYDPDIPLTASGRLPYHAWFTAFAPYEDPEIAVVVFVYNGGEGSAVALPVAQEILRGYFAQKYPPQPLEIGPGEAITSTEMLPGIEALLTDTVPITATGPSDGGGD